MNYADTVNRDVALKLREREAFRLASMLHDELNENGGFSSRTNGIAPLPYGYMVSDGVSEMRVRTCTVETIYRFMLTNWDRIESNGNLFFGGWQTDDYVYLDVSEWFAGIFSAEKVGKERKQIAIYDLKNAKSINL